MSIGTRIWNRGARVLVNGVKLAEKLPRKDGHRIEFRVHKHNKVEPNTADVRIFGLSPTERHAITSAFESARAAILAAGGSGSIGDLVIEAGYDGVLERLCKVDIIDVQHEPLRPGWATIIKGQDGIFPFAHSFVNETIGKGVDVDLVMKTLAASMQIAFLDADSETAFKDKLGQFTTSRLKGGFVLQGPTRKVMTELLDAMQLAWSYNDGRLELLRFDGTTVDEALRLSPSTGLGPVEVRANGRAVATFRLHPRANPGRQVQLEDELGKPYGAGLFRVDDAEHRGMTAEGPWETVAHMRPSAVE